MTDNAFVIETGHTIHVPAGYGLENQQYGYIIRDDEHHLPLVTVIKPNIGLGPRALVTFSGMSRAEAADVEVFVALLADGVIIAQHLNEREANRG